jgi:integrase
MLLARPAKIAPHEHHAALPYREIGGFMSDLRGRDSTSARCLEFLILAAARTGEVIGAQWGEFDLTAKVWTVPANRMKGNREHRVPLSNRAVEIVQLMQSRYENDFVFAGRSGGLSNMSLLAMLRQMGRSVTAHGFRSTFRTWAAEQTSFSNPGYNLNRCVIITEDEHDRGYTMETVNDVVFVLPNAGRVDLTKPNLLKSAKLLMACTPNGI